MEARTLPNRAQRAARRGQDAPKTEKEDRPNINHPRLVRSRRVFREKVANMVPSWLPKSSQNQRQNNAKINRKSDASWNRLLERIWWIFGGKIQACWHQHRTKIYPNFEERFFKQKLCFSFWKSNDFEGSGGRTWR